MKTTGSGNQNRYANNAQQTEHLDWKARTILLSHAGWRARKPPAKGEVFFLTFFFMELIKELPPCSRRYACI